MGNTSSSGLQDGGCRSKHQPIDIDLTGNNEEDADGQFEDAEDDDEEATEKLEDSRCLPLDCPSSSSARNAGINQPNPSLTVAAASKQDGRRPPSASDSVDDDPLIREEETTRATSVRCTDSVSDDQLVREGETTRAASIRCTDVLCGRGGQSNHHPGNVFFRRLVRAKQEEYVKANKREKTIVAVDIVKLIRGLTPPGRFLKKDSVEKDLYLEVGDKNARNKASQALREGAPELRDELREERRESAIRKLTESKSRLDSDENLTRQTKPNQEMDESMGMAKRNASRDRVPSVMPESTMMGGPGQPPFMPFMSRIPFGPGGHGPLISGQHFLPQMVQTPMGPAMLPVMANSQLTGMHLAGFGQQQLMMQAMLQSKQTFAPSWLQGQQQMADHFLMQQALLAGKRHRDEMNTDNRNKRDNEGDSRRKIQKTF